MACYKCESGWCQEHKTDDHKPTHSSLPWKLAEDNCGPVIMSADDEQLFSVPKNSSELSGTWSVYQGVSDIGDAQFIVKAVNMHDRLVEALEEDHSIIIKEDEFRHQRKLPCKVCELLHEAKPPEGK